MGDTLLPESLEAALQRLEKALESRPVASGAERADDSGPTRDALIESLREQLTEAQAEIDHLKGALNQANARRAAALKKVDHVVVQMDDLLAGIDSKAV